MTSDLHWLKSTLSSSHGITRRNAVLLVFIGLLLGHFAPWPSSGGESRTESFYSKSIALTTPQAPLGFAGLSPTEQCRNVVDSQRILLFEHFSSAFKGVQRVALIGYPNHANKGDSAIWLAEEIVLANLGITVDYVCSGMHDYQPEQIKAMAAKGRAAIVFHGGGNLGDIYPQEQELKLTVMKDFAKDVPIRWFPQSIHFKDQSLSSTSPLQIFLDLVKQAKDMQLVVRDIPSFKFAQKHIALLNTKVTMTPDIVFAMGNKTELLKAFGKPANELLVFRREDAERTDWSQWAGTDLPDYFSGLLKEMGSSWNSSAIDVNDWINFDLEPEDILGKTEYRQAAWIRFMQGARWLASGEVVLLDRLHGHILSLLMGIPHVIVDNEIGKLSNYHDTWTKDCPLAVIIKPSRATIQEALTKQRLLVSHEFRN